MPKPPTPANPGSQTPPGVCARGQSASIWLTPLAGLCWSFRSWSEDGAAGNFTGKSMGQQAQRGGSGPHRRRDHEACRARIWQQMANKGRPVCQKHHSSPAKPQRPGDCARTALPRHNTLVTIGPCSVIATPSAQATMPMLSKHRFDCCLATPTEKDAALTVLDTRTGAGLYRLDGDYASTSQRSHRRRGPALHQPRPPSPALVGLRGHEGGKQRNRCCAFTPAHLHHPAPAA